MGSDKRDLSTTWADLSALFAELHRQPKRFYGGDWSDWDRRNTGGQPYPCVYLLWRQNVEDDPCYVGETVDLGNRLDKHDRAIGWSEPRWQSVQYLSHPRFEDGEFRQLFECLCIYVLRPKDNDARRHLPTRV